MTSSPKIFCIGLPRTGTTSLTSFINHNSNYRIKKFLYSESIKNNIMRSKFKIPVIDDADGVSDLIACAYYQEFFYEYPNSKFIFTDRDIDDWLDSCERWFSDCFIHQGDVYFQRVEKSKKGWLSFFMLTNFGSYLYNRRLFMNRFIRHRENVLSFFKDKDNFLYLNITSMNNKEISELLSKFIGCRKTDFYHKNKS